MSAETGVAPHVYEDDWEYLLFTIDHLKARARAASGEDEDIDWDEMYGSD